VAAAGAATLLVELTFMRYVSGQIRVLGYFTNFVLLAAFVGLGVGMLGSRRWAVAERVAWCAPIGAALLVALAQLGHDLRVVIATDAEVLFLEYQADAPQVPLFPFLAASYVAIAIAFVPTGVWVGRTLAGDRPLARYAWNVAGSLVGIGVFAVLSAVGARPAIWVALASMTLLVSLVDARAAWRAVGAVAVTAATIGAWLGTRDATWSPYQKISVAPLKAHPTLGVVQEWQTKDLSPEDRARVAPLPETSGFTVRVNDDSYQTPLDLRPAAIAARPALAPMRLQYDLPYTLRPAGRVLVLGAGTGNDVAAALRAGATSVDAVEIDPAILALGKRHPEHPYDDPRVTAHLTDARSFLARTDAEFDTIVYGLLDSHVLLGSLSNVRLDSYVFTAESFALARKHLGPAGVLVVSHAVARPWFIDRMSDTLTTAFDKPPLLLTERARNPLGYVYAEGENVEPGRPPVAGALPLVDDWPFVYLRAPAIPKEYLIAMALMALASVALVRVGTGPQWGSFDLHFFALGAGFLLLETRGLAVLALLIGSTWAVSCAVFAGVLVMALASTALAVKIGAEAASPRALGVAYGLLFATLAVQFAVDVGDLASLPLAGRALAGAAFVSAPLLASGTIFGTSLARVGAADYASASNLLGAVAGGLAEYASMVVGFRMLVLLAAVFYGVAFLASRRSSGGAAASVTAAATAA
jgi:SAM-dependent methyltransferase